MLKYLLLITWIFFSGLNVHAQNKTLPRTNTESEVLWKAQLRMSCLQSERYTKSLYWYHEGGFKQEEKIFTGGNSGDSLLQLLYVDIEPVFRTHILNPEIKDWFDIEVKENQITGRRKAQYESKTNLEVQNIYFNPKGGSIRKTETIISRSNWLYTEKVEISVYFDTKGRYLSHVMLLKTDIPVSGAYVLMVAQGRMLYPLQKGLRK